MSVTNLSYTMAGARSWLLTWTGSGGPYYVYRDGVLLAATTATSILISVAADENPVITVTDVEGAYAEAYPDRITLGWRAVSGATRYQVQQYDGADWVNVRSVPEDGRACYTYRTDPLSDETEYSYRVVPYSGLVAGDPLAWTVLMVRYPEPPRLSYTYDEDTGTVTVAARA